MRLLPARLLSLLIGSACSGGLASANDDQLPLDLVRVSTQAGDYVNPVDAAFNAFQGDSWCRSGGLCRIEIARGMFVLSETLVIPDGIIVSGAGKGASVLVAEQGVEVAVAAFGPGTFTIRDLTISNSQPFAMRAVGYHVESSDYDNIHAESETLSRLIRVAIHAEGAEENLALSRFGRMLVRASDLTAPGGIGTENFNEAGAPLRLIDSTIAARLGIRQRGPDPGGPGLVIQLVDSHVVALRPVADPPVTSCCGAAIVFDSEESTLDVQGGSLVGSVDAGDEGVSVRLSGTHVIAGGVSWYQATRVLLDGVIVQGTLHNLDSSGPVTVRNSRVGAVHLDNAVRTRIVGSVIDRPSTIRGARSNVTFLSSLLAAPLEISGNPTVVCENTLGADFRPLGEDCGAITP